MSTTSPPAQRTKRGTVYVAGGDAMLCRSIDVALRAQNVSVVQLSAVSELPQVSQEKTDRVLLLGTPSAGGLSALNALASFRSSDRVTPVLLCVGFCGSGLQSLPEFARSGVDDMVLAALAGFDEELRALVAKHLDHALPASLLEPALIGRTDRVRSERAWIARRARRRLRIAQLAEWLRVATSTLRSHHQRDGGLSPHRWLQISRLLHVAHQLDSTSFDLTTIARRLDFPSESDMSMFVHRMTGESPRVLRTRGATGRALQVARQAQPGESAEFRE